MTDRADKVLAALGRKGIVNDLEGLLTLGLVNPWTPAIDFDPTVTAQVAAQGGAAITVHIGGGPLGATFGNLAGSFNVAFMWDDEQVALFETVQEGQGLVAKIGPPLGERLTLWADAVVPISPGPILAPGEADKLAATLGADQNPPGFIDAAQNAIKGLVDKAFSFESTQIQTLIVVGGLVVLGYVLFSGPINKIAAGAAGAAA